MEHKGKCIHISVITVTYNAAAAISSTLKTVLTQDNASFDYYVIDGDSKDCTLDIVKEYEKNHNPLGIEIHINSEKDKGIYDAMNKGIQLASGNYLLFLNAGDWFVNGRVLSNLENAIIKTKSDVIYGDSIMEVMGLYYYAEGRSISTIVESMPFCHQSCVIKRELLLENKYSLEYKICSDYDFFSKCYRNDVSFEYVHTPISVYTMGGFSAQNGSSAYWEELLEIRHSYGFISNNSYEEEKKKNKNRMRMNRMKSAVKRLIPVSLNNKRIESGLIRNGWSRSLERVCAQESVK